MARSQLTSTSQDLVSDSGAVLWSLIYGEQLEFPVTLSFIDDVTEGFTFDAVVVEAENVEGQTSAPRTVQPSGVVHALGVRVPVFEGVWSAEGQYNTEDVVIHDGVAYKLLQGEDYISTVIPSEDPSWEETSLSRVYLQFQSDLGDDWAVKPKVGSPVYGFFELSVQEPVTAFFRKTWKPMRGLVQILFSPLA